MGFVGNEVTLRDILEEHLEALDFLWSRRRSALRGTSLTLHGLADLDERIAAHDDGLVLAAEDGIAVVRDAVTSDDGSLSLAAGHALLGMERDDATALVREALHAAGPAALEGLRLALCYAPDAALEPGLERDLREAIATAPEPLAALAAEALAFHGRLPAPPARVAALLASADPAVRRAAWRIVALGAGGPGRSPDQLPLDRELEVGFADEDAGVRALALEAAAWIGHPFVLEHCRRAARSRGARDVEALHLLAALGGAEDLSLMLAVGSDAALGPRRFELLASFGHPGALDLLLDALAAPELEDAAAAAAAFQRMTGVDVGGGERRPLLPRGGGPADVFEPEFLEQVEVPDPARARAAVERAPLKDQRARAGRLAIGHELPPRTPAALLDRLDLRSRWEGHLRAAFLGPAPERSPADLERFPTPGRASGR